MSIFELPIYKNHFETFLILTKELESLKHESEEHTELIKHAYSRVILIFPKLNSGYNYWSMKGKLQIYNKVGISKLLSLIKSLDEH